MDYDTAALVAVLDKLTELERQERTDAATIAGMAADVADEYLHLRRRGEPAGTETLTTAHALLEAKRLALGDLLPIWCDQCHDEINNESWLDWCRVCLVTACSACICDCEALK